MRTAGFSVPFPTGRHLAIVLGMGLLSPPIGSSHAATSPAAQRAVPPGVVATNLPGVHNAFCIGTNLFSGSSPATDEAFAALARAGVKTVLSVDGARPDVERARRYGLRYVHLPHGYDGIDPATQAQLARAGQELPGPIYVHCHHGLHRSPTAAAVMCLAGGNWTPEQALSSLAFAGTSTNYVGLYQTVREFPATQAARAAAPATPFVDTAKPSGLVEAMVAVDTRWDLLKAVKAAGFKAPPGSPDVQPAHEALMLSEHYREAARLPEVASRPADLRQRLEAADVAARDAERLLRDFARDPQPGIHADLERVFTNLGRQCTECHQRHRDKSSAGPSPGGRP